MLSPFLHWAKTRPAARFDLGGSNLAACTLDEFPSLREAFDLIARNDNGFAPLVDAIAAHYDVGADRIVSTDGCSGANFLVVASLVGPGEDVLIERPAYDPLLGACRLMRANIRRFERRADAGFRIDADELRRLVTPRTRLIVVTHPHNPSGVSLDVTTLRALADVAAAVGAHVLVDEVYLDAAERVAGRPPTAASAARIDGPFLVTNSLTKSYGLAGLRNGWIVAPAALTERLQRTRDVIDNANPAPSDLVARAAFGDLVRIGERACQILTRNLAAAARLLAAHPDLEVPEPPRTSVVFPRRRREPDASPLVRRLAEHDIAVAPGSFFEAPAHFRIGLGGHPDLVARSLTELSAALHGLGDQPGG